MSRYLDPKSDVVFKKIFGQRTHLLKSFLNALLPLPDDGLIDTLKYLPSEQVPTIPEFKSTVVDVKCTDQKGRIFIVEMQIQWSTCFMQRMLFGTSKAYINQLEKGEKYELLKPVYGLGLLASDFDHDTADWYHHYKIVNVKKPEREIKGLQIVFVELNKFKPETYSQKKLRALWLRFMSEINEKSRTVEPELLAIPEIREAIELAEESAFTAAELDSYDKYWDAVRLEKSFFYGRYDEGLEAGLEKGEKIGIEKGVERTKLEIARNLIKKGFSIQDVQQYTDLSIDLLNKHFSVPEPEF